jgi:N-acetyl-anhydromuramyl-L-alanine amidase AmpD
MLPPSPLPLLSINPWKPSAPERKWQSIVIHHTATDRGDVASIHEAHLRRKDKSGNPWLGIGYHFVIGNGEGMDDGAIEPTFRWREQLHGAHAGGGEYNEYGIGIALVGNFEEHPPSPAQLAAIKRLVATLKANYGINSENVVAHSEVKATACPGKYFPMAEVSASVPDVFFGQYQRRQTPAMQFAGF